MTFPTGYRPDPIHVKERNEVIGARPLRARLGGGAFLGVANLSQFAPDVMTQASGSCVGHGTASAAYCATHAASAGLSFVPSPKGIYALSRCLERSGADVPLGDYGAMIADGITAIASWGVSPMTPLADRYSDDDPATVNDEPDFLELERDAQTLLVGAHPITSVGEQLVADVMTALSLGFPVVLGVPGGSPAWQRYSGGVLFVVEAPLDHCVYVLGGDGNTFTIRNSWGPAWGERGNIRVSRTFLEKSTGDRYALSVRIAA